MYAIRSYYEKQVDEFMKEKEAQIKQTLLKNIQEINGIKVIKTCMPIPAEAIKNIRNNFV